MSISGSRARRSEGTRLKLHSPLYGGCVCVCVCVHRAVGDARSQQRQWDGLSAERRLHVCALWPRLQHSAWTQHSPVLLLCSTLTSHTHTHTHTHARQSTRMSDQFRRGRRNVSERKTTDQMAGLGTGRKAVGASKLFTGFCRFPSPVRHFAVLHLQQPR